VGTPRTGWEDVVSRDASQILGLHGVPKMKAVQWPICILNLQTTEGIWMKFGVIGWITSLITFV